MAPAVAGAIKIYKERALRKVERKPPSQRNNTQPQNHGKRAVNASAERRNLGVIPCPHLLVNRRVENQRIHTGRDDGKHLEPKK
jgi:hypothetical protein